MSTPHSSSRAPETAFRLVLTPALTGLLAGLGLAGVWAITEPRIEAHRRERLETSVRKVLPGAEVTRGLVQDGDTLTPVEAGEPADLYAGWDAEGRLLGWAIPAAGGGYQDTIRLLVGYDAGSKTTLGMEVLKSRETPGLGDRIYKDEAFVGNFRGLATEPLPVLVKGERSAANEVQAITGATISSRAVVRMTAEALAQWAPKLEGVAPPAPSDPDEGETP